MSSLFHQRESKRGIRYVFFVPPERIEERYRICERIEEMHRICERIEEMHRICERIEEMHRICLHCSTRENEDSSEVGYTVYVFFVLPILSQIMMIWDSF
jgi:hypothetical protein